jgi:hypothetical protein
MTGKNWERPGWGAPTTEGCWAVRYGGRGGKERHKNQIKGSRMTQLDGQASISSWESGFSIYDWLLFNWRLGEMLTLVVRQSRARCPANLATLDSASE